MKNKILQGDALTQLKTLPEKSINMCMTSPPYWALRDYGTANWEGGNKNCEHVIDKTSKLKGDWDRPSRKEFNKVGEVLECVVCKNQFKGKLGNKFCSTKCLNTLSNNERTNAESKRVNTCSICGAKRIDKQLGLEPTFDQYISNLCDIFDEVKRVLRDDGTCWVNIGDTYGGSGCGTNDYQTEASKSIQGKGKNAKLYKTGGIAQKINYPSKSLICIPFRFAIEMINRGWILRNTIIWHKPNCMPSSVKDRFTVDFEYLFFFSKKKRYYFETQREEAKTNCSAKFNPRVRDSKRGYKKSGQYKASKKEMEQYHGQEIKYGQMRNKRCMWSIPPRPFKEAHFAVYPEELCETPIKAGCPEGGVVLDPFFGAGTTGLVALKQNKKFLGIELNPEYIKIAENRLKPFLEQTTLSINSKNIHSKKEGRKDE